MKTIISLMIVLLPLQALCAQVFNSAQPMSYAQSEAFCSSQGARLMTAIEAKFYYDDNTKAHWNTVDAVLELMCGTNEFKTNPKIQNDEIDFWLQRKDVTVGFYEVAGPFAAIWPKLHPAQFLVVDHQQENGCNGIGQIMVDKMLGNESFENSQFAKTHAYALCLRP